MKVFVALSLASLLAVVLAIRDPGPYEHCVELGFVMPGAFVGLSTIRNGMIWIMVVTGMLVDALRAVIALRVPWLRVADLGSFSPAIERGDEMCLLYFFSDFWVLVLLMALGAHGARVLRNAFEYLEHWFACTRNE